MSNLKHLITKILLDIDRIKFSLPYKYRDELLCLVESEGSVIHQPDNLKNRYKKYKFHDAEICIDDIKYSTKINFYDRVFVTLYDTTLEAQRSLNGILSLISRYKSSWFDEVMLNQVEVSYDFYASSDDNLELIKKYLNHHLVMKYARDKSYSWYFDTLYIGRKGYIRKGSKGARSYEKFEGGECFYRFEMQYNRPFLKKAGISIQDLPLDPLLFQTFEQVYLYDDLSGRSLKNLARSFLRKNKIFENDPDYKNHFRKSFNLVRRRLLGNDPNNPNALPKQVEMLKKFQAEKKLTGESRKFDELSKDKELILCHAAIGYEEKGCSKRMLLCHQ